MIMSEYVLIYSTEISDNEIKIMSHALGLPSRKKQTLKATRNYFIGKKQDVESLIRKGFMKELKEEYFVVTKAGMIKIQYELGGELQVIDFEDIYE